MTTNNLLSRLPSLLRGFGAAAVLFSLYCFLMKGWEGSSDLIRYLILLAHTAGLTVIGLSSGHYLKEAKGARLLITLGLTSVSINATILGAFFFSNLGSSMSGHMPDMALWSTESLSSTLWLTALSAPILGFVTLIGFRTLARGISKQLTGLYLLSCAILLIPLRDPTIAAIISVLLAMTALFWMKKSALKGAEIQTREGLIALCIQMLPLGVLIVRNFWLYDDAPILIVGALVSLFIALRQITLLLKARSAIRSLLDFVSAAVSLLAGFYLSAELNGLGLSLQDATVIGFLTCALMMYELAERSPELNSLFRLVASFIATTTFVFNIGFIHDHSLITTLIGVAMVTYSYMNKQKSVFAGGITITIMGLFTHISFILSFFDFGIWVSTALLGTAAIVAASIIEAKGELLKNRFLKIKERYGEWQY